MANKSEIFTNKNNKSQSVKYTVKDKITVSGLDDVNTFNYEYIKYLNYDKNVIHNTKLNPNEVIIHSDFSENYSMKYSTEI
ncbi:1 2C2-dihydroxy-3-keto-5-methylthiopentene dioxygenase [Aphis craccivora]|uniref:1 2C2-dihydroxy-3-keto-5-methylthiopentene dioxygenase n=1 Tax=Aphis craccivora TaxID=307492 RepID=A0A6G0YK49_APHCR|nr:1 2C2-dihydroxy-3-keto-5-methylthiopentene dioxygenase [Aphis craccivora]